MTHHHLTDTHLYKFHEISILLALNTIPTLAYRNHRELNIDSYPLYAVAEQATSARFTIVIFSQRLLGRQGLPGSPAE